MTRQRVYCVFEGAGARGLAHVAAYKTLYRDDIELVGFAGTSAGAMIATLAAVGYSPEQIYSGDGKTILNLVDLDYENDDMSTTIDPADSPIRLFGAHAWTAISRIRWFIKNYIQVIWALAAFLVVFIILGFWLFPRVTIIFIVAILLLSAWLTLKLSRGIVQMEQLRAGINQIINMKIFGHRTGASATFKDLSEAGRPPLKIVAANITKSRIELFSADSTPDVAIADAICASICIPGVFMRHTISNDEFLDGGIVSNLPAWSFDDERSGDQDALTVAVEISEKKLARVKPSSVGILATLNTILFGDNMLNTRGVDKLTTTKLEVDLGLLDFDISRERADDIIQAAEKHCRAELLGALIDLPNLINESCKAVSSECKKLIREAYKAVGSGQFRGTVRVAIGIPVTPKLRTIRLDFSSGYEDLSDERLTLPIERSFVGQALTEGESIYASRSDKELWDSKLNMPEDRWIRKLLWRDLQWVLCVPIAFGNTLSKKAVVSLDSDTPLKMKLADQQSLLDALEALILERFAFLDDLQKELPSAREDVSATERAT